MQKFEDENENDGLLQRVRALRAGGSGPKQIARALGIRPAQATALIRRFAQAEQAAAAPEDRPWVGGWVNAGWSRGLDLSAVPHWAADDAGVDEDAVGSGFAQLLFARRERASKVTVCGLLVDVYCLGVKDVVPARTIGEGSLDAHRRSYFSAFDLPPRPIGPSQAQAIVHGAVTFARGIGFEPAAGFDETARLLGRPEGEPPAIGFGRDGLPFYINGPRDDARRIVHTLERTCGNGNYHYVVGSGPL